MNRRLYRPEHCNLSYKYHLDLNRKQTIALEDDDPDLVGHVRNTKMKAAAIQAYRLGYTAIKYYVDGNIRLTK